jgi:hypothetical protein
MVVSRQFLMDVAERISKDFPANLVITIGEVILNLLQVFTLKLIIWELTKNQFISPQFAKKNQRKT